MLPYRLLLVLTAMAMISASSNSTAAPAADFLSDAEIQEQFAGSIISYSPPGWADSAIQEVFYRDGTWGGLLYGRGPIGFSGKWAIQDNQICVTPDAKGIVENWFVGTRCRMVGRSLPGKVFVNYLDPRRDQEGPLLAKVEPLPAGL
jgi:hypothetical protein